MGFRSSWALVSLSVSLGFVAGCATQSSDSPIGGGGEVSFAGAGASGNGGHGGSAGTSSSSGAGGTLGVSGSAGTSAGGSAGALAGAGGASAGSAGFVGIAGGGAGGSGGSAIGGGGATATGGGGAGGHGGSATGGGGATATGGGGATSTGGGGATGSGGATGGGGAGGHGGSAAGGGGATSTGGGGSGNAGSGGSGPLGSTSYTLNHFVIGSSGASATVNVSWDSTKLECVFNVNDATPEGDSAQTWNDDAVEIYLDLNNGKTGTLQPDDAQIVVPRLTAAITGGFGSVNYGAITVVRTSIGATGYALDVTVPWSALNIAEPPVGQTIGINLAVDDDTNGGDRDAQLMLSGDQNAWQVPSAWASLLLTN